MGMLEIKDRVAELAERLSKGKGGKYQEYIVTVDGKQYTRPPERHSPDLVPVADLVQKGQLPPFLPRERPTALTEYADKYIAKPFAAGLTQPLYSNQQIAPPPGQVPSTLGGFKDYLYRSLNMAPPGSPEMQRYEQWEDPMLKLGPVHIGVKGVAESLPYMAIPAAGQVAPGLRAVKGVGILAKTARVGGEILKPVEALEQLPGKVVGKVAEKFKPKVIPTSPSTSITTPKGLTAMTESAVPKGGGTQTVGTVPTTGTKLFADLPDADETVRVITQPDAYQKAANLPGVKSIFGTLSPSSVADTPAKQFLVGRAQQRFTGQQYAQQVMSNLRQLGSQEKVFGKVATDGTIAEGVFKGLTPQHISENFNLYATKLTPEQSTWIKTSNMVADEKLAFLKRNGIDVNELSFENGGHWADRKYVGKFDSEGNLIESASLGAGPGRPGAKLGAEKSRVFADIQDATAAGFRPMAMDEAQYWNTVGAYNRVADKGMTEWLLERIPWRKVGAPQELIDTAESARITRNRAKALLASYNKIGMRKGWDVNQTTIDEIAKSFPTEAANLKMVVERQHLMEVGKATPIDFTSSIRRTESLVAVKQSQYDTALTARLRASEQGVKVHFGEATVPAPAFAGKILTGSEAQETARLIGQSLSPHVIGALDSLNKFNALQRLFALAGDASIFTIQLIFGPSHMPEYMKSANAFVRGLIDEEWIAKYLVRPENQAIIQKSRNLIVPTSGTMEATEALGTQGILNKGLFRIAAKPLKPFSRGYENAMTVAGVEMRKALDHLCTTPENTAAVEDFINAFRGLASSQRLGVSPLWRSTERAAMLAPQYNRSIAALLFDLVKFGGSAGVAGGQARRSLALGITAIAAASVGISIAAGETPEQAAQHLNPKSQNFMTWDVAGQRVGPGSKVRSLLAMMGKIVKNPSLLNSKNADELLSYNPLVKFMRGNLSGGASTALDLITGKDYIGDPTRDGLLHISERVLAQNLVPLWIQSSTLEGGTAAGRGINAGASFMGLRSYTEYPNTPQGQLDKRRDEISQQIYKKDYSDLTDAEKTTLIKNSIYVDDAVRKKWSEAKRKQEGGYWVPYEEKTPTDTNPYSKNKKSTDTNPYAKIKKSTDDINPYAK